MLNAGRLLFGSLLLSNATFYKGRCSTCLYFLHYNQHSILTCQYIIWRLSLLFLHILLLLHLRTWPDPFVSTYNLSPIKSNKKEIFINYHLSLLFFSSPRRIRFYAVAAIGAGQCVRLRCHPRHQLALGPESAGRCGAIDARRPVGGGVCGAAHRDHCGQAGSCHAATAPGATEAAVPEQQTAHDMQHGGVPVGERVGL